MKQLLNLTDNARQRMTVTLDNGDSVEFSIYYYLTQRSWFFDFTYNDYVCKGQRMVLTPNALRHLRNILPFGIAFTAEGNVEPYDINDFKNIVKTQKVAALMMECIQGEGGVNVLDKEFYKGLEKLCKDNDILLIVDEVQSGFGRCGSLFAHELYDIKPDIMTVAKGIGGGFPMAAFLATEEVSSGFVPGDHGTTFAGSPLAGAVANAVFDTIKSENLVENSRLMGEYLLSKLNDLANKYDFIKDVRGAGLLVGLELDFEGGDIVGKMFEKGFLINCTAGNVLRFAPPLIVKEEEIDALVEALDEIFAEI